VNRRQPAGELRVVLRDTRYCSTCDRSERRSNRADGTRYSDLAVLVWADCPVFFFSFLSRRGFPKLAALGISCGVKFGAIVVFKLAN
jgi:hypothetical protein